MWIGRTGGEAGAEVLVRNASYPHLELGNAQPAEQEWVPGMIHEPLAQSLCHALEVPIVPAPVCLIKDRLDELVRSVGPAHGIIGGGRGVAHGSGSVLD